MDIRFVTSINGKIFGVGAVEASKIDPLSEKVIEDEGKLIREGKDVLDKLLQTILINEETPKVTGWMLQLSGLRGQICTIRLAKPGLYVTIPQSPIQFPSQFTSPSILTDTMKFILTMCQSMNNLALDARNAIFFIFSLNQDSIPDNLHI